VSSKLPHLQQLVKHAQQTQERLAIAQAELAETEVTGKSGNGLVSVTMTGTGEVTRVVFNQAAIDEGDAESLAAMTLMAIRNTTDAIKSLTAEKITEASGNLTASLAEQDWR
jgi:DNA-binding YbaB/EbfC family protein